MNNGKLAKAPPVFSYLPVFPWLPDIKNPKNARGALRAPHFPLVFNKFCETPRADPLSGGAIGGRNNHLFEHDEAGF